MSIRFGIIGCGNIAPQFISSAKNAGTCRVVAVAARDYNRAKEFADQYCIDATPYGSYEQLCSDPAVDAVYVATPHSHHYEHVMLALKFGKHVLCEKILTTDAKKLKRLFKAARDAKLLLMEGMWSRFLPSLCSMSTLVKSGELGKIKKVSTTFCFDMSERADDCRLKSPNLAGGALFDLGVYPFNTVLMLTDEMPLIRNAQIEFYKTGVDATSCMTLCFSGFEADIKSSITHDLDNKCHIILENGTITTTEAAHKTSGYTVESQGKKTTYMFDDRPIDFSYEIKHFNKLIEDKTFQSPIMGEDDSMKIITLMDEYRGIVGLKYPFDEEEQFE